jgi:hypothetical protein
MPNRDRPLSRFPLQTTADFLNAVIADQGINIQLKEQLDIIGLYVVDVPADIFIPIDMLALGKEGKCPAVQHEMLQMWYKRGNQVIHIVKTLQDIQVCRPARDNLLSLPSRPCPPDIES